MVLDCCEAVLYGLGVLNVARLAVLRSVVATGSVSAAAAEIGYTPSAISQQIAALERETGMQLLERVGRRVRPTAAGSLLAEHAGDILERLVEAEAALDALGDGRSGQLRLAAFPSAGTGLVPPAVGEFRRCHPDVDLQLRLAEQAEALSALRCDQVDMAVILRDVVDASAPDQPEPQSSGLVWEFLLADPYFVVLPADHPLTAATEIRLADLADERLVSADRSPLCPCGEAFQRFCAAAGFAPRFAVEVDDYPTCQSLVGAGVGIATIPLLGLAHALHDGVAVRPLVAPRLARRIYTVTRSTAPDDVLTRDMRADLRRATETLACLAPGRSSTNP